MNPFLKKGLKSIGAYVLGTAMKEFEIISTVKQKIKTKLFWSLTVNYYQSSVLHSQLTKFLILNYKNKIPSVNTNYDRLMENGNKDHLTGNYDIPQAKLIIKYNGCRIYISKVTSQTNDNTSTQVANSFKLHCLRKDKHKVEGFLKQLIKDQNDKRVVSEDIRAWIYNGGGWNCYRQYTPIHIDNVILPIKIKDKLIGDIDKFLSRKNWYVSRNLSFKRGYLFFGKPRNGKSSLIEAIARKYKRDIFFLNLNSLKDETELLNAFRQIHRNSILIIEDIDTVWDKREAVLAQCNITFSTFINLMSGVLVKEDILIFFTTNHYDKLDPALIGNKRVDLQIEIPHPTHLEAEQYLASLYEEEFKLDRYVEGRSMGAIFNLFEEYMEDLDGLKLFLNKEEEKTFEDELIPQNQRILYTQANKGDEHNAINAIEVNEVNIGSGQSNHPVGIKPYKKKLR